MPLDPPSPDPVAAAKDWLAAPRQDLLAHLVNHHHRFTREQLTRLGPCLEKALRDQAESHPELIQINIHFRDLEADLLAHLAMEEKHLFPAIHAMAEGGPVPVALSNDREVLLTIQAEHQAVEELFLNIRLLSADYTVPGDAGPHLGNLYRGLRDLEDDLHVHLYLENHLLFAQAQPPGPR